MSETYRVLDTELDSLGVMCFVVARRSADDTTTLVITQNTYWGRGYLVKFLWKSNKGTTYTYPRIEV